MRSLALLKPGFPGSLLIALLVSFAPIPAFPVTLDGRRYGERFDCILQVEP